jgi:hypothetical protein|tara:strand:+ start:3449 stop:3598 length:150 start_codon:yes stop_codon:yes gene_type:complete
MIMEILGEVSFKDNGDMIVEYNTEIEYCKEIFRKDNNKWINIKSFKKKH